MTDTSLVLLSVAITGLALIVMMVVILSSRRSVEQQVERADIVTKAAARRADELQEEVDFLRQLDSVRVTERYLSTKSGIEQRSGQLEREIAATRERAMRIRRELESFLTDSDGGQSRMYGLKGELARTLEEVRRLESAIESVSRIGPLPLDNLRSEIARRRQHASDLRRRLERADLDGDARKSEIARLQQEAAEVEEEERRLRREQEVTHLLAPAIDSLLGVTPDLEARAARVQDRIQASFGGLPPGKDPLGDFLRVLRGELPTGGRLLTAGTARTEASGADTDETTETEAASPVEPAAEAQEPVPESSKPAPESTEAVPQPPEAAEAEPPAEPSAPVEAPPPARPAARAEEGFPWEEGAAAQPREVPPVGRPGQRPARVVRPEGREPLPPIAHDEWPREGHLPTEEGTPIPGPFVPPPMRRPSAEHARQDEKRTRPEEGADTPGQPERGGYSWSDTSTGR